MMASMIDTNAFEGWKAFPDEISRAKPIEKAFEKGITYLASPDWEENLSCRLCQPILLSAVAGSDLGTRIFEEGYRGSI
jgi:hypothetical protein